MAADSEKPSDASHEWWRPNVMASVASSKFCVKSSEEFGESQGWDGVLMMRVNLVLEELALNVRDYGVVDGRRFDILIDSSPSSVRIDFSDDGLRFDPTVEAPEPDVESGIDSRPDGGLGVYIVKAIADELAYSYEMGKNRLTMSVARSC